VNNNFLQKKNEKIQQKSPFLVGTLHLPVEIGFRIKKGRGARGEAGENDKRIKPKPPKQFG